MGNVLSWREVVQQSNTVFDQFGYSKWLPYSKFNKFFPHTNGKELYHSGLGKFLLCCAMGESLEDLKQIVQENDDVANRLANSIITQAPEINKQMEALKASGQRSPVVSGALKKWGEVSGLLGVATVAATAAMATGQVKTAVTNAKMIVTGVVEIASLLGAVAVPGLPIVATAAKSILGILGRSI